MALPVPLKGTREIGPVIYMEQRVKHRKYGIGTIKSEKNFGYEKCVHFDSGLHAWIHHEMLTPVSEDETSDSTPIAYDPHSIESLGHHDDEGALYTSTGRDVFSIYYDGEPESTLSEQEPLPTFGLVSSGEESVKEERRERKESEGQENVVSEQEPLPAFGLVSSGEESVKEERRERKESEGQENVVSEQEPLP
ncbi:hypothetical protein, partial [Methanocalculus sp.]|uniref:hypothetical protein n=1 Tax=Methanocalculus sp. TaxID=2004547 RepID=UPI00271BB094